MKKIFTLMAAVAFAATASAQVLSFDTKYDKGAVPETIESNGFVLTCVDTDKSKLAVDGNTAYFGTVESYKKFDFRLKTGGKSSSKNNLTLTVPADGTLLVYARTGSNSDNTRTLVLTQNDVELVSKALDEAEAVKATIEGEEKNVYPAISAEVKKGDIAITYPVNSINIYGFELVSSAGVSTILTPKANGNTYNLSGVKVSENVKGLKIKNGKKFVK